MATAKKTAVKRKPAAKKAVTTTKKTTKKSNAGTVRLKKIVALAKVEYGKSKNNKKWVNCIKDAAKKLK